jgi:hypothetical protein
MGNIMKKGLALLLIGVVLVSLLLPLAFLPKSKASSIALDTINITLIPGIVYFNQQTSQSGNTSAGSLSIAGAHLTVEVDYANGTVFSVQNVVVDSNNQISIQVPNNTQVRIFVNVTGVGVSIPISYVPAATFTQSETTNLSVAMMVYPVQFVLCNGTVETVRLAVAWTYNESSAVIGDAAMKYTKSGVATQAVPWYLDSSYNSNTLSPGWPYSGYLAGLLELGPDYYGQYEYWVLGKQVTVVGYGSNGLSTVKTPPAAAWAFLNGSGLIGVWVHHVMNVGYNIGPAETTYYLLYNKADTANDTAWLFTPVNFTTGWAVFEPWLNLSVSYGYKFAYMLSLNVNNSAPVFAFPSLAGKGWVYAAPTAFGPMSSSTSMSFNKTLTVVVNGSSMSIWFNGTGINALEIIGPNFQFNNISSTGTFYTNVTGGFAPLIPTYNKWPYVPPKKVVRDNKVYALALNSTSTSYIIPYNCKSTATPTSYAYGTYILYTPYRLSNSTSSTAYVVIKGQVRTLYGNYTVPNGTVEIVVDNGNTNVYTVNVSVESGAFSSPALALSPTTNYTYKIYYYNASSTVLSSNASNTNVVFNGDPSGFSTLTVASTSSTSTSTTTPTTTPTSPTSGPSLGYVLLVVFIIVVVIVAIAAIGKSVEHTVFNASHRYVKEEN